MRTGRAFALLGLATVAALGTARWQVGPDGLWASPDQRGRLLFQRGDYGAAAGRFLDPMWRGVAQMRGGDFKAAAQTFAGIDTAEAAYDQGNALVMLGRYDEAVARYDRALALQPGWASAQANRTLAGLRAARMKTAGGEAGDQREGADQIVYDKDADSPAGQNTETAGAPMSDAAVRALWLKRVQTRPADFLRARFGAQMEGRTP